MKNAELTKNDLLSMLRNEFFIIAIYLYFMGWIYAYYLFNHFGISLNSVDIPVYYFFVYSYSVIINGVGGIIIVAAILLTYLFAYKSSKGSSKGWAHALISLILIGLIPILFYLAKEKADREARYIRMGNAKRIIFTFKKDTNKFYPKEFIDANNEGKLRILTQTKDRFYIFCQPKGEDSAIPYGSTYDISRTDIILANVVMISDREVKKWLGF